MPWDIMVHDYLLLMAEGCKAEQDLKRELSKTNYLNIRDRKSKKERFK